MGSNGDPRSSWLQRLALGSRWVSKLLPRFFFVLHVLHVSKGQVSDGKCSSESAFFVQFMDLMDLMDLRSQTFVELCPVQAEATWSFVVS